MDAFIFFPSFVLLWKNANILLSQVIAMAMLINQFDIERMAKVEKFHLATLSHVPRSFGVAFDEKFASNSNVK